MTHQRHKQPSRAKLSEEPPSKPGVQPPAWLLRSVVYRRLPIAKRGRLDAAILLRPAGLATLEAIAERFGLECEHGVTLPALRQYARRLEEWAKPAVTSQVFAAILGCLPESYRRKIVAGSEVLLLSRVVQTLSSPDSDSLSVAELAKLASLLGGLSPVLRPDRLRRSRQARTPSDAGSPDKPSGPNTEKLATAVRVLYGLPWPINGEGQAAHPSKT